VDWLNLVDTSYRQEFKDLFDANFRRLEAEMAGLRVHLESEMRGLREHVEARVTGLEGVMSARMCGLEDRLDTKLEKQKSALLFWNFVFWIGTIGALVAMLKL
jgi:hypothetical protein